MKKAVYSLLILLLPFCAKAQNAGAVNLQWAYSGSNTGGKLFKLATSTLPPVSIYTKTQLDSIFALPNFANIENQNSAAQTANFWISGNGQINGSLTIGQYAPFNVLNYQTGSRWLLTGTGTAASQTYAAGAFQMEPNPSSNSNSTFYGINSNVTSLTNSTHTFAAFYPVSGSINVNGTSVLAVGANLFSQSPFFGATGTITTQYGAYIQDQASPGVTTPYAIYQHGASDINYIAGNTGVQTTTPTANFQVNQSNNGVGLAAVVTSSDTVKGTGTQFLNTLAAGQSITVNAETHVVSSILSNSTLVTTTAWAQTTNLAVPHGLLLTTLPQTSTIPPGTYYVVVTAVNGAGETTASSEQSISVSSGEAMQVSWVPSLGVTSYNIYIGTSSGAENVYLNTNDYQTYLFTSLPVSSGTPPGSNTATGPITYTLVGGVTLTAKGNGAIAFPRLPITGVAVSGIVVDANGNFISTFGTPSIAAGAAAGSSPTVSIAGNNQDGIITLVMGSSTTTGTLCTITMSNGFTYAHTCSPVITLDSNGTSTLGSSTVSVTPSGSPTSSWQIQVFGAALTGGDTYEFTYHNGGN